MDKTSRDFILVKPTKNTYKFQELPIEGEDKLIGYLYIQKSFFAEKPTLVQISINKVQ